MEGGVAIVIKLSVVTLIFRTKRVHLAQIRLTLTISELLVCNLVCLKLPEVSKF